jgi:AcrR family transcriptional regulator
MAHIPAEQRKDEFVEAAVAVIAEHGVRGATTRRIAEAANAPLASLHYCFATKEELFFEAFNRVGASLVPEESDPADKVTAGSFLRSAIDWMLANRDYALAQVDLYLWILRTAPAHAAMPYETIANALSLQLAHSYSDTPKEVLADAVWLAISAVDGLVLQWFYRRDDEEIRRLAETQAELLDRLMEKRRPRRASTS